MIFKKPYAFLVKYFRFINFILSLLSFFVFCRLVNLHSVLNKIYYGDLSNYTSVDSSCLGFLSYFLVILIILIVSLIIILLKKKEKPLRDYLLSFLYNCILIVFFLIVRNMILKLESTTFDIATLKLYSDVSLIIIFPCLYFIIIFGLISIGFNLKKFNFSKDIIEIKKDDNEEIELIFNKNTYKYKRSIRKYIRELKYYFFENKFIITIILLVVTVFLLGTNITFKVASSNEVKLNKNFVAGNFSYTVKKVYESKYDLNHTVIKKDFKFVIIHLNIRNVSRENMSFDFNKVLLSYGEGDKYIYPNNYFNKYFLDLGTPYNNEIIKSGDNKDCILIFKVPSSYKKNSYQISFYDKNVFEENELKSNYKELNVKSIELDNKIKKVDISVGEKKIFDQKRFGNTSFIINSYSLNESYIYKINGLNNIIVPENVNQTLLILETDITIDEKAFIYFSKPLDFYNNYLVIQYFKGDKVHLSDVNVLKLFDNKVFLSVPNSLKQADSINILINFRNLQYIYKLK